MAYDATVYLGVNPDGVKIGLKESLASLEEWGRDAPAKLARIGPTANEAGAAVISLSDRIKKFTREERSEHRTAGFFVNKLAEIVPISTEAKGAITELSGAMAFGGPLAIAIAGTTVGIGFVVKAIWDQKKAADEALESTKKWAEGIAEGLKKAQDAAVLATAASALERTQLRADQERRDAAKEQAAAMAKVADLDAKIAELRRTGWRDLGGKTYGQDALVEALTRANQALVDAQENYRAVVIRTEAEITTARKAEAEKQTKDAQDAYDKQLAAYKHLKAEIVAVEVKPDKGGLPLNYNSDIRTDYSLRMPKEGKTTEGDIRKILQEEYNRELERTIALSKQWASTVADGLTAVVLGEKTATAVLEDLGRALLRQIIDYMVQAAFAAIVGRVARKAAAIGETSANTAVAVSGAAAAVAAIPFVGPALVPEAMAATFEAVTAATVPLLGMAERGYRVPDWVGSRGVLTNLHPGEHVLPKRIARNYEGAGGGGLVANVNIMTPDAKSFLGFLRSQDNALLTVLSELVRDGRLVLP